jgi:hypothetical protein
MANVTMMKRERGKRERGGEREGERARDEYRTLLFASSPTLQDYSVSGEWKRAGAVKIPAVSY